MTRMRARCARALWVLASLTSGALFAQDQASEGAPAPVYRTLKDAAEAGVNPVDPPDMVTITVVGTAPSHTGPIWPAVVGWTSLVLALALIGYVIFSARRRARNADDVPRVRTQDEDAQEW